MSSVSSASKPWAVLAYTVADDKSGATLVDAAAKLELKALCDAADFDRVSVAAQVDFKRTKGIYRGVLTEKPRDFEEINPDQHPLWRSIAGTITRSRLKVLLEKTDLNAAHAAVLEDFLRFGQRDCRADRHVIAFYGHAYGPMGLFFDAAEGRRDPNTLRLNDLASSIEALEKKAAVVMFRDCFMSTIETAYQLRNAAEFMLASQSVVPIAGVWPWGGLLNTLLPSASSDDVAMALARELIRFLDTPANRGPFADAPFTLVDLGAAAAIVEPLKALTNALDAARGDATRSAACARALEAGRAGFPNDKARPGDPALLDLLTVCDGLGALDPDPVAAPAKALSTVVNEKLVRLHQSQAPSSAYRGVSVFYQPVTPNDIERSCIIAGNPEDVARDAAHYEQLALCQATGWHRLASRPLPPA